ncbi:MAG: methylamine utilization protein [Caulobacteraceae bacterium]
MSSAAIAADVTVRLKTTAGQPVRDAVVTVYPVGGGGGAYKPDAPLRIAQKDIQFDPFVIIVPVGAEVAFPNLDKVRHHVYSFSPAKRFQLKLYGREETRTVKFDTVGVVALGCNIHDQMAAFVKVVDTPFAAKTDASGVAVVRGAPAGAVTVKIWQPYMKTSGNEIVRTVTLPREGLAQDNAIELRTYAR